MKIQSCNCMNHPTKQKMESIFEADVCGNSNFV